MDETRGHALSARHDSEYDVDTWPLIDSQEIIRSSPFKKCASCTGQTESIREIKPSLHSYSGPWILILFRPNQRIRCRGQHLIPASPQLLMRSLGQQIEF